MTWRLMAFFTFVFTFGTVISAIIDGNGGFVSTTLTANLAKDATTATVTSTDGFYSLGYVVIEGEQIIYTAKTPTTFTVGANHREHVSGQKVYTEAAGALNAIVGFDTKASQASYGTITTVVGVGAALLFAIPKMLIWDYSYLNNDVGTYIRLFGWTISAGMVIALIALLRGY